MGKVKNLPNAFYLQGHVIATVGHTHKDSGKETGATLTLQTQSGDCIPVFIRLMLLKQVDGSAPGLDDRVYCSGKIGWWKPDPTKAGFAQLNVTDFRILEKAERKPAPAQKAEADDSDLPWKED